MATLDPAMVAQAAPPGSMRQLAILFSPADKRGVLEALHVIEHEVFTSARHASHDVAHTRLQWWRAEVDRLVNDNAQHPATRLLSSLRAVPDMDLGVLQEMLVAADMDLARMTYDDHAAFAAYARRAGGVIHALGTRWLAAPRPPSQDAIDIASRLGGLVRQSEALRDVWQDVRNGLRYLPQCELEHAGLAPDRLLERQMPEPLRPLLGAWHERITRELARICAAVPPAERASLRHTLVLARLHERVLQRLQERRYDVAGDRVELGPIERVWVAWRAARSTV